MPDNDHSASRSEPDATPVEIDLFASPEVAPRVKKRSLKPKPSILDLEREAPPLTPDAARPEYQPKSRDDADADRNATVKITEPSPAGPQPASAKKSSQPIFASTTRPTPSTSSTTSPHGTRPATLYYSTGSKEDKEAPTSMKSTTPTAPTPGTSSSSVRTAAPAAARPATVVDYRTNIDRQAREQKSVGGVLSILVYTLIGFFVVGAALAGYGAYVVHQALHNQSVTVSQLDERYSAANKDLNTRLATTLDTLTEAQAQIGRQQELILKQQETINKLLAATDANAAALRQERTTRADETSTLRARVRDLEYKGPPTGPTTQRY